jgi:hypothetical protein
MANEQNYIMVLLPDQNTTDEFPCPKCKCNDIDMLQNNDDNVTCLNCGEKYKIKVSIIGV